MWAPFKYESGCSCEKPAKCTCFGFSTNSKGELSFKVPLFLKPLIDEKNPLKALRLFVNVLSKYNKHKTQNIKESIPLEAEKEGTISVGVLEGYLDLIDDLYSNGEFRLLRSKDEISPKKINWKKTLKNEDLIISGKNLLYGSFYSKSKTVNRFNQFYVLYKEGLRRANLCLFGLTDLEMDPNFPDQIEIQEKTIQDYLESHFSDRDLKISIALKKIFIQENYSTASEKAVKLRYHPSFEHIWQALIQEELNAYLYKNFEFPVGTYNVNGIESSGLALRPDHLVFFDNKNKKSVWILDSKYYCEWDQQGLPGSADITKQLLYYYLVKSKSDEHTIIRSGFVFPKNPANKENIIFKKVGSHKIENLPELEILCYSLCVEKALLSYVNNWKIEEMTKELTEYSEPVKEQPKKSAMEEWGLFEFSNKNTWQNIFEKENKVYFDKFVSCLNTEGVDSFLKKFNENLNEKLTLRALKGAFSRRNLSTCIKNPKTNSFESTINSQSTPRNSEKLKDPPRLCKLPSIALSSDISNSSNNNETSSSTTYSNSKTKLDAYLKTISLMIDSHPTPLNLLEEISQIKLRSRKILSKNKESLFPNKNSDWILKSGQVTPFVFNQETYWIAGNLSEQAMLRNLKLISEKTSSLLKLGVNLDIKFESRKITVSKINYQPNTQNKQKTKP